MKTIVVAVHFVLIILAYSAWVWLDYRILAILAVAHLIMLEVLQGCPLSHAQFTDSKDKRFYEWWMEKVGVKFTKLRRRKVRIFMQYILPLIIIGLGIVAQVLLGVQPLISL